MFISYPLPGTHQKRKERKMITYIVNINYTKFEFMHGNTALTFAELAKNAVIDDAEVEIELKAVPDIDIKGDEDDDF